MTDVEENWQTKMSTIKERTAYVFNNEFLSDVQFIVPVSNAEFSESQKTRGQKAKKKAKMVIPAHKFVLSISSPVFYAMFFGKMAETADSIELPDCEYVSVLEFFRYLYSDEVNLSGNNVMHVFYLATKYMVPSLAEKCNDYLRAHVEGSNVFSVLLHAQKFEVKDLESQCWEVIKTKAVEAVNSDEFVTLERSLVETVVKMEKLYIKEMELFKAVDRWVTKEIERQGLTPDSNIKRQVLGEDIVKAIRFPLMSQKEFASVVPDCNILSIKEVVDMMKYYSGVLTTPLSFTGLSRFGPLQKCRRFINTNEPNKNYQKPKNYRITVSTSKHIFLHGVQLFGREHGSYTADVNVAEDIISSYTLTKQSGTYVSKKYDGLRFFFFDVLFDQPVCLEGGKRYKIESSVNGQSAWRGSIERTSVERDGVSFTFSDSFVHDVNSPFCSSPCPDIPVLLFTLY